MVEKDVYDRFVFVDLSQDRYKYASFGEILSILFVIDLVLGMIVLFIGVARIDSAIGFLLVLVVALFIFILFGSYIEKSRMGHYRKNIYKKIINLIRNDWTYLTTEKFPEIYYKESGLDLKPYKKFISADIIKGQLFKTNHDFYFLASDIDFKSYASTTDGDFIVAVIFSALIAKVTIPQDFEGKTVIHKKRNEKSFISLDSKKRALLQDTGRVNEVVSFLKDLDALYDMEFSISLSGRDLVIAIPHYDYQLDKDNNRNPYHDHADDLVIKLQDIYRRFDLMEKICLIFKDSFFE